VSRCRHSTSAGSSRRRHAGAAGLVAILATLTILAPASLSAAAEPADNQDEASTVSAGNDAAGFVPALEPPAFAIGGYIDVGFADATGDGTSFHPADQRLPADYAVDAFAPAVNSRGDVASTVAGGRLTNGFLPRSAGTGGHPSFLLNTLALEVRRGQAGDPVLIFARVHLMPRLEPTGSATRLLVEQAFGRVQPFEAHELLFFVGKFDSVFGIEYLDNQSPQRIGVTPSLLARYTTGTSIGAKLFYRLPIELLSSAVSLNLAATNSAPLIEVLQAADVSRTGHLALTGRLGYELNLPGAQVKLGGSAASAARNDQGDADTGVRLWGVDLRATLAGLSLAGEFVHLDEDRGPSADKLTGAGPQLIASAFHVRGLWAQLHYQLPIASVLFRRSFVYLRGEQRRGWFEGFARVRERRLTVGVRLDLGESVALKAEILLNREYEGAPDVANDVRCASLVWAF
jgi:hypothetical protein